MREYLEFLADNKKTKFVIPICIKQSHFCGMIINKATYSITYFNPTSHATKPSREDKDVFEKIDHLFKNVLPQFINTIKETTGNTRLTDETNQLPQEEIAMIRNLPPTSYKNVPNIANVSTKQQTNGCDCGYIVSQNCIDSARDNTFSVPPFDAQKPEVAAKAIAQVRANFVDPGLVSQEISENTCFDQWTLRLAKALCENSSLEQGSLTLLRFVRNTQLTHAVDDHNLYGDLFDLVKGCVEKLDQIDKFRQQDPKAKSSLDLTDELKHIFPHGSTTTESVHQYLLNECKRRQISLKQLKSFCNHLLTTKNFTQEEKGDVIFVLNSQLLLRDPVSSNKLTAPQGGSIFYGTSSRTFTSTDLPTDEHHSDYKRFAP